MQDPDAYPIGKTLNFFSLGLFLDGIDHFEQIVLVFAQLRGIFDWIVVFLIVIVINGIHIHLIIMIIVIVIIMIAIIKIVIGILVIVVVIALGSTTPTAIVVCHR